MTWLMNNVRYSAIAAVVAASVLWTVLALVLEEAHWRNVALGWLVVALALVVVGVHDLRQKRHAILRNYPILAHLRFFFEEIRPEIRQYFLEGDREKVPFSRTQRGIVYERCKDITNKRPFGTLADYDLPGHEWLTHSLTPQHIEDTDFRIVCGGPDCRDHYFMSCLNISAMSFGALSANAIRALNAGAKRGEFAHDTGEGSISCYHREHGGDLIWEIGSGYFGCRDRNGRFDAERFAEHAAEPQVKMIEIKLSQGAKPGHGGILPGTKVTPEIAAARGVMVGEDCVSPPAHSAFTTPVGLLEFVALLRARSNGKPVGFKLCIGHPWEFLAVAKAMLETGIVPDFIVVDGAEGGTGAAPQEFVDHIGTPLRDGLIFVHNTLTGIGLRHLVRIGASGKIVSAFDMARAMALGADWCNSARGFMFALGCIQAQACHTDKCPTGVTTQDPVRQRALVVEDKATRVYRFHKNTLHALAEVVGAAGLRHPRDLRPHHLVRRLSPTECLTSDRIHRFLAPGELLAGTDAPVFRDYWARVRADRFALEN